MRTRSGSSTLPRRITALLALVGALFLVIASASSGLAAGTATPTITHIESTASGLQVVVSLPADNTADLSQVTATVDGTAAPATAASANDSTAVKRTTILLVDTSDSMNGARFTAAKAAALQFISSAPADVEIGVVGFASSVKTYLAPTTDRSAASSTVDALTLSRGTLLYAGVESAVKLAGRDGQRGILLLSDGADTSKSPIATAASDVKDAGVLLDAVTLDTSGQSATALKTLTTAGQGRLIPADPAALASTFTQEAAVLSRQVVVTIQVPATAPDSATVQVSFPSASGTLTAAAYAPVRDTSTPSAAPPSTAPGTPATVDRGFVAPQWVMYAGIAVLGVGLVVLLPLLAAPRASVSMGALERVRSYTAASSRVTESADEVDQLATAKDITADILRRNQSLNAKITHRLEGAGSDLRTEEWLLLHFGIFFAAGVVGLLLGKGNFFIGLLFLLGGAVAPWVYLGFRRTKRRKQFNSALPDTLQLMSGSLSAGLSLAQSVDTIVREGSDPVASEFRRVLIETRLGVSLEDAMEGVAERFESKDFEWVVMAIKIQRQVGGNLAELLNTVADTMREREYIRRQVAALAAEGKLSAWVLGLLPPLFMVYLLLTNHSYVIVMFQKPLGILMLSGAVAILGIGVFWMSKLIKVEV